MTEGVLVYIEKRKSLNCGGVEQASDDTQRSSKVSRSHEHLAAINKDSFEERTSYIFLIIAVTLNNHIRLSAMWT